MKRVIPPLLVFALLFSFQTSSSETNGNSVDTNKNSHPPFYSKPNLFNLVVTCLSNHSQLPGGQLMYNIRLTSLTAPVANALVKINDPIDKVCTFITTGSDGNAVWLKQIPKDAKPQIYVFEFFYETEKQYSKVAVFTEFVNIKLPGFKINLDISQTLDPASVVLGNRGGFSPLLQSLESTVKEAVKFGDAVAKDFLSSNTNKSVLVLGGVSCIALPGNPVCVAALTYSLKSVIQSEIKVFRHKIIDATVESKEKRELINNILDLGDIAISVALLKPGEGLVSKLDAISLGEEFIQNAYNQYNFINKDFQWASFAAQIKGSNDVILMCVYNRSKQNPTSVLPSKDPNCNENQNGDYCFQNNTELDLIVNFHFNSEIKSRYQISPLSFTLQPGQKQCFFDVPEGASRYEIISPAKVYGYGSTTPKVRDYNAEGTVYVDRCKESNFSINFTKPSYSTSNPALSSSKSKENTCIVSNTGDLCFKNETKLDLKVRVLSSPIPAANGWNQVIQYDCTLQPGQIQCFFGVPSGTASYEIFSPASINGYGTSEPLAKSYHAESQIYVETCRTVFVNVK